MRLLILYAFVGLSSAADSLVADVGRALNRISSSRDSYTLIPGVRFEARKVPRVHPRRGFATLIDSAEDVFTNHDLVWDIAPGLEIRIFAGDDPKGGFHINAGPSTKSQDSSRTFGVMRRMKMILLPIMYKLGVITTLLTMLTVFALKGLTIGVILLVITTAGLLSKFKAPYHEGWSSHQKDVHLHVHGGSGYVSHPPWDRDNNASPYNYYNSHPPTEQNYQRSPWDSYIS